MTTLHGTPTGRQSRIGHAALATLALAVAAIVPSMNASLATTVGAAPARAIHAGNALPTPSSVLARFSPAYIGNGIKMTQAQAIAVAQQFDVIASQMNAFANYVGVMKAANPNLRILVDFDGTEDSTGTAYPSSWYATSSTGSKIRSVGFGFYLMNPANPAWGQWLGQQCAAAVTKYHYDGCFLDSMGGAALIPGYCTALPLNPSTGLVWTLPDWLTATGAIARSVQSATPGALVIVNGLADGARYFSTSAPSSVLLAPSGVAMAEIWGRLETQPATTFRTEAHWLQDVNMLVASEARGQSVLAVTKLWVTTTAAQQAQWHKFTLGTFLLGAGGHSYYSFLNDKSNTALTADYAWDHVNIGTPLGAFAKVGGLYQRSFTNGIVVVNPTTVSVTLPLGGTFTNLDGSIVTSETFAPGTGDVLLHS